MGCRFSKNPLNASVRRRRRVQQQAHRHSLPQARRAAKSCFTCLRHNFPVITITVFLVYSYYAFAVELCLIPILHPEASGTGNVGAEHISLINFRWLLFAIFNFVLIMFVWSYYTVVFSRHHVADPAKYNLHQEDLQAAQQSLPPPPPPETAWPRITASEEEDWIFLASQLKAHNLGLYEREAQEDINGLVYRSYRYCILCQALKPDRAHHCRKCQCCILRFDHHCPYTNNCVGFDNYKAYLLAIIYGFVLTSFTTLVVVCQLIAWFVHGAASRNVQGEWRALAVWIVLLCITIPACGMVWLLLYLHCGLASLNRTNIEHQVSPETTDCQLVSPYRLESVHRNWRQIFTGWSVCWLLPIKMKSAGNGLTYPKRVGSIKASELNIFKWLNSDADASTADGLIAAALPAVVAGVAPALVVSAASTVMTAASAIHPAGSTTATAVKLLSSKTIAVEISASNIGRRSSEAAMPLSVVGLPRRSSNVANNVIEGSKLKPRNSSVTSKADDVA